MTLLAKTTRFTRGRLPHWEVEGGRYFVTVRCNDSLPGEVVNRLRELNQQIHQTKAASTAFVELQRRYFLTMEKFLDAGEGEAPLRRPEAANALKTSFDSLAVRCGCSALHHHAEPLACVDRTRFRNFD